MSGDERRGWVGVERHWSSDPKLSDAAFRLMIWLDSHTADYLETLTVLTISEQLNWDRKKVKRTITELVGLKLLTARQLPRQGGGTRTKIALRADRWHDQNGVKDDPQNGGENGYMSGGEIGTPAVGKSGQRGGENGYMSGGEIGTPSIAPPVLGEHCAAERPNEIYTDLWKRFIASYPDNRKLKDGERAFRSMRGTDQVAAVSALEDHWGPFWAEHADETVPWIAWWLRDRQWEKPPRKRSTKASLVDFNRERRLADEAAARARSEANTPAFTAKDLAR